MRAHLFFAHYRFMSQYNMLSEVCVKASGNYVTRATKLVLTAGAAFWLMLFVAKLALVVAVLVVGLVAIGIGILNY